MESSGTWRGRGVPGQPRGLIMALMVMMALGPARALADRGAITLEGGGALRLQSEAPSVGAGSAVAGTTGGARVTLRYGLTNRLEVQASGFWDAHATFVQEPVAVGSVSGALTQDVGRWGAAAGVRYVVAGLVWRVPVGLELGWAHTSVTNRDLVDTSDPRGASSLGLRLGESSTDQPLLAPFVGLEWLATDHLRFSVVPRLEVLLGRPSTLGVVVPFTAGWSWYRF
jgi:hypothetical protein